MERPGIFSEHFTQTIRLIEEGMRDGAHERPPRIKSMTEDRWRETVDIGLLYFIGPETTLESIGRLRGVSRQSIGVKREKFIKYFHGNCSPETQKNYPLEEINIKKPSSGEKLSFVGGGRSVRIKEQVQKGVADPERIAANLGWTAKKVKSARGILSRWGIELDKGKVANREHKEEIAGETDDEKLQMKLNSFPANFIRRDIQRFRDKSPFMYLGTLLINAGFKKRDLRLIYEELRSSGIPSRPLDFGYYKNAKGKVYRQIYWIIYAKHQQRVINVLSMLGEKGKIKRQKD